jgi:hypothetical protein
MTQYKGEDIVVTLADLEELIARGDFHHATYRDVGMAHEGLAIYARDPNGFRGYRHIGTFPGGSYATADQGATCRQAERVVAPFGTSVGSFGGG